MICQRFAQSIGNIDVNLSHNSRAFLLRQIWIVKCFVKYSVKYCKYLLFLQDFFFRLKPKQYKKYEYYIADCLIEHL